MMRKHSLLLLIALLLVLALASAASAEQLKVWNPATGQYEYQPTPKVLDAAYPYPDGIYLPNSSANEPWNNRIHTQYTKNTDACASCHATHTAVGPSLLQWTTIYATCMACHDGTISYTYNVLGGYIVGSTGARTGGGLFGGVNSASMHNVAHTVNIGAAPGGNPTATDPDGNWGASFSCNSCHNPHGTGGNSRILHPNPNRVSTSKTVNVSVADTVYYRLDDYALRGFGYEFVVKNGTQVVPMSNYRVLIDQIRQATTVEWVYGAPVPAGLSFTYTPSVRVTMEINDYLRQTETVSYVDGINEFCGACHRDYNATSGSQGSPVGVYTKAYRHPVGLLGAFNWELPEGTGLRFASAGGRQVVCLTCHVAHGADEDYWADTLISGAYWAGTPTADLRELSGSSVLKRIPNMGACEACHLMGPANLGYNVEAVANVESKYTAVPGATALGDGYVGSLRCSQCHEQHYMTQRNTLHTRKIQPAAGNPDFQPGQTVFDSWKPIANGGFANLTGNLNTIATDSQVTVNGEIYLSLTTGVAISRDRFAQHGFLQGDKWRLRFAFPYDRLTADEKAVVDGQQSGRRSRGLLFLRAQFYTGQRGPQRTTIAAAPGYNSGYWVTYSENTVWQDNCFVCHTTGFDMDKYVDHYGSTDGDLQAGNAHRNRTPIVPRFDPDTNPGGYIADYGITCEACHGPGANHIAAPTKDNIVNPARLSVVRQNDACGACHARAARTRFFNVTDGNVAFRNASGEFITINNNRGDATTAVQSAVYVTGFENRTFDATTFRMMYPGEKLTDFSIPNNASLTAQGLPNQHRMQWQEMNQFNSSHNDAAFQVDSNRSLKGRIVSCNTCHDSHKYNAGGESLKVSQAALCSSCHAGGMDIRRAMPYIVNAGGSASGNQNDILNLRSHSFDVSTTDKGRWWLSGHDNATRNANRFNDRRLPASTHDATSGFNAFPATIDDSAWPQNLREDLSLQE